MYPAASQMIMPVMVLALQTTAQVSRYMRASMLDNLSQDYVRTARAKGLKEGVVVMVHVLRNSMIPYHRYRAWRPSIFGGAIITENVLGERDWPAAYHRPVRQRHSHGYDHHLYLCHYDRGV